MPENNFPPHLDWITSLLPENQLSQLLATLDQPLDISIRLNPLKIDVQKLALQLEQIYHWQLKSIPFCDSGFWIEQNGENASRTIEHRLGHFYIQEAASMLPVELFDLGNNKSPLILDMAASPGGKTTHLAARTGDKGLIIANDASRSRISALQIVLGNWGAVNHAVSCQSGEIFGAVFPDQFDAVLLDAPCSMQGLRTSESHSPRTITTNEINQLAQRQVRLLESALQAAKPGGQIVYSTCTLTYQENEAVLAEILDHYPNQIGIADVSRKLPFPIPGLAHIGGRQFPKAINHALRIWPHLLGTAGFFTAKLVKKESLPFMPKSVDQMRGKRNQVRVLHASESENIQYAFMHQYGLNLVKLMEEFSLQMAEINHSVYLMPIRLHELTKIFPWITAGISLGKTLPQGWQPAHNFATRFGNRFTKGIVNISDSQLDAWQRGEDLRGYKTEKITTGVVVLVRDAEQRILGLGKLLENRLRNLLPTRLF